MISVENTCSVASNYLEYYHSCPSINHPVTKNWTGSGVTAAFQLGNGGRKADIPILFLRNFFESYGYAKYFMQPEQISLDRVSKEEPKFTHKNHHDIYQGLWITNKVNPKKIGYNLENFIEQTKKVPSFEATIWTNISPQELKKLNPELELNNIKVKNIAELDTNHEELLDFVLSSEKHIAPNKGSLYNGLIIDTAKYLIAEAEGGFIADLNFKFSDTFSLSKITQYDFIAADKGDNFIENGFFYAKPHHLVFQDVLNIVNELLFSPDCAVAEFRDIMNRAYVSDSITDSFSMSPLAISYVKNNNKDGNVDVLISSECEKVNSGNSWLEELEPEISAHAKNAAALFSGDMELFNQFANSYLQVLSKIEFYSNCIDADLVGADDNTSMTWWGAGIV